MRTRQVPSLLVILLALGAATSPIGALAAPAGKPVGGAGDLRDGSRDFDFLVGSWKVKHRRLRNPLTHSTTWVEFEGTSTARNLWGNRVSYDENVFEDPAGRIDGMTMRFYDARSRQWSLYWASNTAGGLAMPATVGSFEAKNGRGEFFDQEPFQGRMILVRYVWFDIGPDRCRWEQAFSDDGGKTWEVNWEQWFTRVR